MSDLAAEVIRLKEEQGLSYAEIGKRIGRSGGAVRSIYRRARGKHADRRRAHKVAPEPEQPEPDGNQWLFEDQYVYNADNDRYITFLRGSPKPLVVPGDTHRAMKRAYSDWDGQPATINQICRTFSIPRPWFNEYRRIHGWTHDAEPFSAEEVATRSLDEMVEDALQMRRQALYQRFEKEKWAEIKKAADRWWDFEQALLLPLTEALRHRAPNYAPPRLTLPDTLPTNAACLVSTADLHFGKYGWEPETGRPYGRQLARERLLGTTQALLERILRYGRPAKFIVVLGGDDEHIDNDMGATSKGTPQDRDGSPAQALIEYGELVIDYIELIRQVGSPVEIYVTPGNHNRHTAILRAQMVAAWYRTVEGVTVHVNANPRVYVEHGDTLIGLTHGDGIKPRDLGPLMATEAGPQWGRTRTHVWFTQHLHHERVQEVAGVKVYQMPSLSGSDRWHARAGYTTATPGASAYLIEETGGVCATVFAPG